MEKEPNARKSFIIIILKHSSTDSNLSTHIPAKYMPVNKELYLF